MRVIGTTHRTQTKNLASSLNPAESGLSGIRGHKAPKGVPNLARPVVSMMAPGWS